MFKLVRAVQLGTRAGCGRIVQTGYGLGTSQSQLHPGRSVSDKAGGERKYIPAAGNRRNALEILAEEIKPVLEGKITSIEAVIPRRTDVLIIGGGIVGSAVAFWLKNASINAYDITIVEKDYCYTRASSMLSVGGLRHQFTLEENVQMSMFTTEFLQNIREHLSVLDQDPPEVQFHHNGYLFLAPGDRAEFLESCVNMQRSLGAKTELLSKSRLAEKFPWLNLDGIEVGSYGPEGEGWFDPWQLINSIKAKNINMGVRYCEGEVVDFRFTEVETLYGDQCLLRKKMDGVDIDHKDGRRYGCDAAIVVNCAGPWAGEIAKMAQIGAGEPGNTIELPVEPRKRYVYVVHCPNGPTLDTPLTVDPSGVYFRREGYGGHYLCGASPLSEDDEPDIGNLNVDYDFYNEYVWPTLAHRVPCFENSKMRNAWSGFYDYNTFDQNLIIGHHPYHRNLIFANGMSGHGVQQGVAIGRAVFELIVHGEFRTIDLSRFSFNRFVENLPMKEHAIV